MLYLALNLFIFVVCSILHIGIHRFFAKRGIFTLKTAFIFILGLIVSIYITTSLTLTNSMSFRADPPAGGAVEESSRVLWWKISRLSGIPPDGGDLHSSDVTSDSVGMTWNVSIPYSGIIFYILMVGVLIIFYTTPSFSNISPSTMILRLLKKNGKMSYQKLSGYFSDESLINLRLKDLHQDGLIFLEKDKFKVTPKGNRIIKVLDIYRKLFGWSVGG